MSEIVQMIRATLTRRYITLVESSSVGCTTTQTSGDNFIVHQVGTDRVLRTFSDPNSQLQKVLDGNSNITISSSGSLINTSPPGTTTSINIFTEDSTTGERHYLRVGLASDVSLELESTFNSSTGLKRSEYEFDLITVLSESITSTSTVVSSDVTLSSAIAVN